MREAPEQVAIGRELEEREKELAKARQGTRTNLHPAKLAEGEKGETHCPPRPW